MRHGLVKWEKDLQITMITFWSACHLHLPTQKSFRLRQPWQGRFTRQGVFQSALP